MTRRTTRGPRGGRRRDGRRIRIYRGPQGGRYYLTASGRRRYLPAEEREELEARAASRREARRRDEERGVRRLALAPLWTYDASIYATARAASQKLGLETRVADPAREEISLAVWVYRYGVWTRYEDDLPGGLTVLAGDPRERGAGAGAAVAALLSAWRVKVSAGKKRRASQVAQKDRPWILVRASWGREPYGWLETRVLGGERPLPDPPDDWSV